MVGSDECSYVTYRLGGLFTLRIEDRLCPDLQKKIKHCLVEGGEPDLTIKKGDRNPTIEYNPRDKSTLVSDGFVPVVVVWRGLADEMLVSDGRYEVVRQGGVYEVSPGHLTLHGQIQDPFVEHQLLRPLVNEVLVRKGAIMVHGGAVRINGKVALILGESGKTSLILSLLSKGADYLSDEMCFLDVEGRCSPYTPYIWMDDRHFIHFPELMETCYPDPEVRRRMAKNMSFFRMGYTFQGKNFLSRQLRELLMGRMYYEGLTCRFDQPFPKAQMPAHGPVTHVFHLRATNEDGPSETADHRQIASMESACAWIKLGYPLVLAKLAGMPTIDLPDMQGTLANAIKGAKCYRVRMKTREKRTKESYQVIADEIWERVNDGHGPGGR